eukprot:gene24733-29886_t
MFAFFSVIFLVIVALCCVIPSSAVSKAANEAVVKEDLPYIACDVCMHYTEALVDALKNARKNALKGNIDEFQVSEVIDSTCNAKNETGEWLRHMDISTLTKEDGKVYLTLTRQEDIGKCESECKTIEKSCQDMLEGEVEVDDLSAYLWRKKSYSVKEKKICKEFTPRCKKPKVVPDSYIRHDLPFTPMSEKEYEMEKMLENMKSMGMGGTMYNRDDMMNMGGMGDGDLYEDEDQYSHLGDTMGGQEF